jgi:hypothetical protein
MCLGLGILCAVPWFHSSHRTTDLGPSLVTMPAKRIIARCTVQADADMALVRQVKAYRYELVSYSNTEVQRTTTDEELGTDGQHG